MKDIEIQQISFVNKFKNSLIYLLLLLILNSSFFTFHSYGQEWNLQAELDSAEVHKKRTMQKFVDEFDKFLINDFLREGLKLNKLISTAPFLQYPALNPDLGAYLADFENETGTTVIIRAYIDITYFNPWVVALRASQKAQKAFEINRANPAYTIIDIAYSPTGMKNKYDVAGYNIIVRDSLRTSAFKERFSDEDFARMRDTIQAAMGNTVATVDTLGFNSAIIRGLEALKGDLKMKPDPGYKVTFRKGDAAGYDTYKYPALNSNYQRDAAGNPIPWLAIDAKQTQTLRGKYYAADTEAAKETPLKINAEDLAAGSLTMEGDSVIKQTITPAGRAREMTVEANYSRLNKFGKEQETVAGQIAVAAYEPLVMNVVIVHQPDRKPDFDETVLQKYLNEIYRQAVVSWNVQYRAFNYSFPSEIQIGNALLSSYSNDMNTIIKAFKKDNKIDSKTYYVFMVSSISDGVSGYMPMKGQFGFVKNTGDAEHTIAHELGHGAFRFWHTFSEKNMIAAQGMTDNLMDYTPNGTRLYKHQWDLVHNPETLLFNFMIDEEEQMAIDKILTKINLTDYKQHAFITPAGDAIIIPDIQFGTFNYDGGLLNLTLADNSTIYGVFKKYDNNERFVGYYKSEVKSLFPVGSERILADSKTLVELEKHKFTKYSFAPINYPTFTVAKIINKDRDRITYTNCHCDYKWVNNKVSTTLTEEVKLPLIPEGARKENFSKGCEAAIYVDLLKIPEGIATTVFTGLFDDNMSGVEIAELVALAEHIDNLRKDKRIGFYVNNNKNTDLKYFIQYLKERKIYTKTRFDAIFQLTCRDYDIVFSDVDLWDGINRETYNINSRDYVIYKSKGIEKPYEYSLIDLITRYQYVRKLKDRIFTSVIIDAEISGEAQAIAMSEGVMQYEALFGTTSALFAWGMYFNNTIANVIEVGVAAEIMRCTSSMFKTGKSSSGMKKLISAIKKLIKSDIIDDLIKNIDNIKLQELVNGLRQNENFILKVSNGKLSISAYTNDYILKEIAYVEKNTLWVTEIRQMDNVPSGSVVKKLDDFEVKLSTNEIGGKYEFVIENTGFSYIRKIDAAKVGNLSLGKFVKKIGDYEVYEGGEVFYRAMSKSDYDILVSTRKLSATSETFTSPTLEYIKAVGYGRENGVIVKFQMKQGTLEKLESIGVRNDNSIRMIQHYPNMQEAKTITNWIQNNALFKTEGSKYGLEQINIGLGKGKAISEFNENIINFEIIK